MVADWTPERSALLQLLESFRALSDDSKVASRLHLLYADGSLAGEVTLSLRDLCATNQALGALLDAKLATDESALLAPLPVDESVIKHELAELDAWLTGNEDGV